MKRRSGTSIKDLMKLKKQDLILQYLLDEDDSPEDALRYARMRKVELVKLARKEIRRRDRPPGPCPNKHEPGDPKCDLMCWVVNISPPDTTTGPFFRGLGQPALDYRTAHPGTYHQWYLDDPVSSKVHTTEHIEKLGELYAGIEKHFAVPEKEIGWWVRIPYGWWLALKGRWHK